MRQSINTMKPRKLIKYIKMEARKLNVKSKTENLSEIRDFVSNAAKDFGFNQSAIENIILAVDEACTNIIKHAYKYNAEGEIVITIHFKDSKFSIEIKDYGNTFEPDSVPAPDLKKYYEQHRVGGLGMYLMKTLMDEVQYDSVPGKYNKVRLSKKLMHN